MALIKIEAKEMTPLVIGDPKDEVPGKNIVLPSHAGKLFVEDLDLNKLRRSSIKNQTVGKNVLDITPADVDYLVLETNSDDAFVRTVLAELGVSITEENQR